MANIQQIIEKRGGVMTKRTAREIAMEIAETIQCHCDLDNWEPEQATGHSCVCPIHKKAIRQFVEAKP